MALYRMKPVVVEATQYDGVDHPYVVVGNGHATVLSRNGWIHCYPGDWIVRELGGDGHYPVHPEYFAATYEAVEE